MWICSSSHCDSAYFLHCPPTRPAITRRCPTPARRRTFGPASSRRWAASGTDSMATDTNKHYVSVYTWLGSPDVIFCWTLIFIPRAYMHYCSATCLPPSDLTFCGQKFNEKIRFSSCTVLSMRYLSIKLSYPYRYNYTACTCFIVGIKHMK